MGIAKCYECQGNVSDRAASCVHCGAPTPSKQPDSSDAAGTHDLGVRISRFDVPIENLVRLVFSVFLAAIPLWLVVWLVSALIRASNAPKGL